MRIQVMNYPATFEFSIRKKDLPTFISSGTPGMDYDCIMCEVRNNILYKKLKQLKIRSYGHGYEDYVVEVVTPTPDGEIWQLSS